MNWLRDRWKRFRVWLRGQLVEHLEPRKVFWALFLGIAIGATPFWGVHLVMCLFAARVLKLNKGLMLLASGIANPITAPPLLALEGAVGSLFRTGSFQIQSVDLSGGFRSFFTEGGWLFFDMLVGSLVVGPILGAMVGAAGVEWFRRYPLSSRKPRA